MDSNALMMLFEFSINLDEELSRLLGIYKIIIPSVVMEELKELSEKGKGHKRKISKPALRLAKRYFIYNFDTDKNSDDALLELAEKLSAFIITNDKELRRRLKNKSLKTIYLRNKSYLAID